MKYICSVLFLLCSCAFFFPQIVKGVNPVNYLPPDVSFVLYLNSFDKTYDEFKDSYFWHKYKLTQKGKDLDQMINSLNASSLLLGGTLNDLLEIFSKQAVLGIWLEKKNEIKDYVYLIEKKKGKNNINLIVQRLEYFSTANKIELQKSKHDGFTVYDFSSKVFLANNDDFVLISNNSAVLSNICYRIEGQIFGTYKIMDFEKYFQNKNCVFYYKKNNPSLKQNDEFFYSFRFHDKPEIEILYNDKQNVYTNQYELNKDNFKFLPSGVNFIYSGDNDIRNYLYPFFTLIGANFFSFDREYFNVYFSQLKNDRTNPWLVAGEFASKITNFLRITDLSKQDNSEEFTNNIAGETFITYKICKNDEEYYTLIDKRLISSKQLNYLKRSLESYKYNKGFNSTANYGKMKSYGNKKLMLWMDMDKYIVDISKKYNNEIWAHYNAYIKTFSKLMISYDRKDNYFYMKLFFY